MAHQTLSFHEFLEEILVAVVDLSEVDGRHQGSEDRTTAIAFATAAGHARQGDRLEAAGQGAYQ